MSDSTLMKTCSCPCGESSFHINEAPIIRFYCHCLICQELYKKPYADVTVLPARAVMLPEKHDILFKKYRGFPAIERGTCPSCGMPLVAMAGSGSSGFAFVAATNYPDRDLLPEPALHIFYHRRTEDCADDLPKVSGYIRSQLCASRLMLGGMFQRK